MTSTTTWQPVPMTISTTWQPPPHDNHQHALYNQHLSPLPCFILQENHHHMTITTTWQPPLHANHHHICFGAQSFVHFSAQTQLCSKKLFMWFQWFIGSKLWPNNTVNTKFCVEMFLGAHISQPPQNALYHTVQMVLVDPCDRLISRFW